MEAPGLGAPPSLSPVQSGQGPRRGQGPGRPIQDSAAQKSLASPPAKPTPLADTPAQVAKRQELEKAIGTLKPGEDPDLIEGKLFDARNKGEISKQQFSALLQQLTSKGEPARPALERKTGRADIRTPQNFTPSALQGSVKVAEPATSSSQALLNTSAPPPIPKRQSNRKPQFSLNCLAPNPKQKNKPKRQTPAPQFKHAVLLLMQPQ